MRLSEIRTILADLPAVNFILPDGSYVPSHFHVTEVGIVTKHFIDCGGTERTEEVASFQLWEGDDDDHRLTSKKFLHILDLCKKVLGHKDLEIEVEYQQQTIGKYGLGFNGTDLMLTAKNTACLALDYCVVPNKETDKAASGCSPAKGCC